MKKKQSKKYLFALLPFLILVGLFEVLPVISIIVRSFMPQGGAIGVTLENYIRIFYHKAVSVSDLEQSVYSSLFLSHRTCCRLLRGEGSL